MKITPEFVDRLNANTLYQTIGLRVTAAIDGHSTSELRPEKAVCWPFPGQPHGGILFTQMDTTMAWAVISLAGEWQNCGTVNMEIQYPQPATGQTFTCVTRVVHSTGRTCFVNGECRDENNRLVAMAQATFRILRADHAEDH